MSELSNRPFTYGEKACGVNFNPGGDAVVAQIKAEFAAIVDKLHNTREAATNPEVKRMLSVAITEAQTAQMWAVKAVTWSHA
jgi:streptogramin lyase